MEIKQNILGLFNMIMPRWWHSRILCTLILISSQNLDPMLHRIDIVTVLLAMYYYVVIRHHVITLYSRTFCAFVALLTLVCSCVELLSIPTLYW